MRHLKPAQDCGSLLCFGDTASGSKATGISCSSGMAKMEEGEKSRQEKHCWQVKERQAKANPRQEPKGNLKGRTLSPQVKQAAAVQHTALGSLQLRYHNTGGEGLWLYTATVWQGQFLLHSLHILMFQRHCPMPALRTQVNF